jgi:hypothetical protein
MPDIDADLAEAIEAYRKAKRAAADATAKRLAVERAGHYDNDTPLSQRAVVEGEPAIAERLAALALADEVLEWLERVKG